MNYLGKLLHKCTKVLVNVSNSKNKKQKKTNCFCAKLIALRTLNVLGLQGTETGKKVRDK